MELYQIRYFLAVAETLNFTSAADKCAVSQPALSKAVRKLEESLGAKLLDRTSQQVELTDFGRTMKIHFERIEDNRRKALDVARFASQRAIERLDVGVMCTIGPQRFSRFLEAFRRKNSQIEITLHDVPATVISEMLLSGSLNCAFCASSGPHDQRFEAVSLFEENIVIAFGPGHRFADLAQVPLREIAAEPYLDRLHCEFRDMIMNLTKASGLELVIAMRSEREDWTAELIQNGLGVSVLPESSAILSNLHHRPISDLQDVQKLELLMTESASGSDALAVFRNAAEAFDWA